MKITSHFLGISLNNKLFSNLFDSLNKYLKENKIENVIELQNIKSLHITLYYFGKELNSSLELKIKKDLVELNRKENIFSIHVDKMNFFKKEKQNYLGYLCPLEKNKLEEINSKLKQNYISEVDDNNYIKYIPHITIYKIRNFKLYKKHDKNILKIINLNIKNIKVNNAFKEVNLFVVDSNIRPEKQTIVI